MFSKTRCKLQLSIMNKFYPKLAYPDELKNYYMEGMSRDAYQNINDYL